MPMPRIAVLCVDDEPYLLDLTQAMQKTGYKDGEPQARFELATYTLPRCRSTG